MSGPGEWWRRLLYFVRRDRATAELTEEMRLHRELRAQALRRDVSSPLDAHATARAQFGNPLTMQEASRRMWGMESLDDLRQDIRYAARRLRQRPAFALPVIAILALGIGATTAMFSAVDAALLRPLPFTHPDELVSLPQVDVPFEPGPGMSFPTPRYHSIDVTDIARMPERFSHVAAWGTGGLNLSDPRRPQRLSAGVVTADFFGTLGLTPALGRGFNPADGRAGGGHVVLLSWDLWQREFGGKEMINRNILLNDIAYQVIGVMPRGFNFPGRSDVWIPMSVPATPETFEPFHGVLSTETFARLAPGTTADLMSQQLRAQWETNLGQAAKQPENDYLRERLADFRQHGAVIPFQQSLVGVHRTGMFVLLGATGVLLLIVCANVTNLLLSHAVTRRREIAVRVVIGATHARIVRQLLAESLLLACAGSLAGVAMAPIVLGLLQNLLPSALDGVATAQLDLRVLGFATVLGLGTGVLFGLWPALGAAGASPIATIKSNGGHGATSAQSGAARRILVTAEIALTVVLLIGAGLMLRSFQRILDQGTGMVPEHVGTLQLSMPERGTTRVDRLRLIDPVLERLRGVAGVTFAGAVNDLPLNSSTAITMRFKVDGAPVSGDSPPPSARQLLASADYFRAMGIILLAGRTFNPIDDTLGAAVAIISASMANQNWPAGNALGHTFSVFGRSLTVVGIVGDVRELSLESEPLPQMYLPINRQPPSSIAIVARSTLPPAALLGAMRSAVQAVNPAQAIFHLRMMDDVLRTSIAPRRTNTLLISLFAGLALVLASLGVYAVVAHGVAQRAREFGIRAALGATRTELLALVSRSMLGVAVLGIALGLGVAWAVTRVAASLLYQVTAHDGLTFLAIPLLLLIPIGAATVWPAYRAARVNPADVMRAD